MNTTSETKRYDHRAVIFRTNCCRIASGQQTSCHRDSCFVPDQWPFPFNHLRFSRVTPFATSNSQRRITCFLCSSLERTVMATSKKAYKYSVELNIHAVDAPSTQMKTNGDLYINICLLGVHKRTHRVPPSFPMHLDQQFYFEKVTSLDFIDLRRSIELIF